ncbi:hypothetical protein LXL04_013903 [Taraxacum kok-saghyz]
MDQFELYFKRADTDQDGRISGTEAVSFFHASGLPTPVLAQIWTHADQNRTGYLGRPEFYNALKLVTVAQSKMDLTSDIVKAALYGPASAKIPAPKINLTALSTPHSNLNPGPPSLQIPASLPTASHTTTIRQPHLTPLPNQQLQPNNQRIPVTGENIPSSQSWPKMTQTNIQKYTKVFVKVDTDRDGKITDEQAHTLFLSWELPRGRWDPHCIVFFEGVNILKQVWDLSDQDNDSMLSLTEFCIALFLMERHREGHPLPKVLPAGIMFEPGVQQVPKMMSHPPARPPRQVPAPTDEDIQQPKEQKPKVPVIEKDLVEQLSDEEQSSLNSKLHEATEVDKKVGELEKEILEARQKIDFYKNKMQEIVLYKSRCNARLNEIIEMVCGDRKEVESLSKKYEDKYKETGDVASKLTVEEATFRDIQVKKMEIYQAIAKLDQGGKTDDIQVLVDGIQEDLEVQIKTLNDRCKMYGLRGKPNLLVELPFGWQGGIQEEAFDWDENWDKFEDEGFAFVKDLTLDVQNVIAPPKQKSFPLQNKSKNSTTGVNESVNQDKGKIVKSPPEDTSPNAVKSFSGERSFDEEEKPTFDINYDSEASWDYNAKNHKDLDGESVNGNTLFDSSSDGWNRGGLNPIRIEIPRKSTYTFDSIPGTPAYSYAGSPPRNNLFQNHYPFPAFDNSVPSTPAYSNPGSPRGANSHRPFADSIPVFEHHLFNKFSRFDSFSSMAQDSEVDHGFFPPQNLTRHDSMHSTCDSDFGNSLFQTRDSFPRFDSMRSSSDSTHGFPSFDDADPFGSNSQLKRETPSRDSLDGWKAF